MLAAETMERHLVLASSSPRRRELMGLIGLAYSTQAARVDERHNPDEPAESAVLRLAREKAVTVALELNSTYHSIVIGADTVVVLDGEILGKPEDAAQAETTLRRLRSREHHVYTAFALLTAPRGDSLDCLVITNVPMRDYSDEEIRRYVRSGDPFDKAGAYAIQNRDFRPVVGLKGCYANVMGFPLCHLTVQLRSFNIEPSVDVSDACQKRLGYRCSVFGDILNGISPPCEADRPALDPQPWTQAKETV